ncbi:MAG: thiazole synthase [bacterium]|nr:thiazole synthase [bacterium]
MSADSTDQSAAGATIAALQSAVSARDPQPLIIAGRTFHSRLFVGTGKFSSNAAMASAIDASCSEMVTVALRRIELDRPVDEQDMISAIDRSKTVLLPNTSGARNAEEAVRLAHLARELGGGEWLKLEVTPDPRYLLPDPVETLKAAEILVKDGFHVLPYMHADPVLALRLQDAGCATVMPLGSPIGSNQGIRTKESIAIIIEQARVPVVVDAGLGAPSHAAEAMELGADAVLVNTALAVANDPAETARAFALAVLAGRLGRLHGVGGSVRPRGEQADAGQSAADRNANAPAGEGWKPASASSPLTGFLDEDARG